MKTKISTLILLVSVLFIGCKDEKSLDSLDVVAPEVINAFVVTLDVTVKKDDDLSLYYTTDGSIDFSTIAPIWKGVKGSNDFQTVVFTLPEDIKPTQLRLDFGMNKEQEDIILKSIKMEYIGKSRTIACPEFVSYFRADDNKCTFDPVTGVIKSLVKDSVKQFPSLYPHESTLGPEIQKILN
jgi:hypothetical protein